MKSPNPIGRIGPARYQDWYRALRWAAHDLGTRDTVLIVSGFTEPSFDEASHYAETLRTFGIPAAQIEIIRSGMDTISQLAVVIKKSKGVRSVVYCSPLHYPRVWWLTRHTRCVRRRIVFGIPRPKEAVMDIALALTFPIIDLLGLRPWLLERVARRRTAGKL